MYLISSNPNDSTKSLVRKAFQKAIHETWIKDTNLANTIIVKEQKAQNNHLKKIEISSLNIPSIEKIWVIELENDPKRAPIGLNTGDTTPEIAILVLQKKEKIDFNLKIILVEMKTTLSNGNLVKPSKKDEKETINNSTLFDCLSKFEAAMSRLYMILSTNDCQNPLIGYQNANILISFIGCIFYCDDNTKTEDDIKKDSNLQTKQKKQNSPPLPIETKVGKMFDYLKNPLLPAPLVTCKTILKNDDKIKTKTFKCATKDSDIFLLKDLI